jgi:hypothetical protein
MRTTAFLPLALIVMAGCLDQRPVLYPNDRMRQAGGVRADRAIDDCMQRAEDYVNRRRRGEVIVEETVTNVAGPIDNPTDRGDYTPVFRGYVNRCLRGKGYEPLAWN